MTEPNRAWYERPAAVREYSAIGHLEPPEEALLDLLRPSLGTARMLDVGVGAGRTTLHFAPLVREYVGVDYSAPLVEACRRRFEQRPGLSFEFADARTMPMLADGHFDLVLFSVNGIDCLDHRGRLEALGEIARVCRPGALFLFSSHSLDAIHKALSVRSRVAELYRTRSMGQFVPALARRLPEQLLKRAANPSATRLLARDWAWISKLWPPFAPQMTYHVKPAEARRQVEHAGFVVDGIVLPSGATVPVDSCRGRRDELWLNYLCRRIDR
ncbi:MAG: class I SAM-dependent methyltransferase [Actinomycetota bacterium]|nr:class I SAM-dependent methyltransferase [Actinomycetota bacterium]